MENEIKIGDRVKLKSGGQEMIVMRYCIKNDKPDKTRVLCGWHNILGDKEEQVYPINGLVKTI